MTFILIPLQVKNRLAHLYGFYTSAVAYASTSQQSKYTKRDTIFSSIKASDGQVDVSPGMIDSSAGVRKSDIHHRCLEAPPLAHVLSTVTQLKIKSVFSTLEKFPVNMTQLHLIEMQPKRFQF